MENIRSFALVVVDNFDNTIARYNLDYVEAPKNLGFEIEYTTLESHLTTYFTSAREKKLPTTLTVDFLSPNAYQKANIFKAFVQKYIKERILFEYNDTTGVKYWEGKIQKCSQEELTDWGALQCSLTFLPGTPKFIRKDDVITVKRSAFGKSYPLKYPYSYGKSIIENNRIENDYFGEIPLRIYLYGEMTDPQVSLVDESTGEIYSSVRFSNLYIAEDEHLVIDAINSKVLLYRDGKYVSAYDYIVKDSHLDSFLHARENTDTLVMINLKPSETGYLKASYRQYTL